MPAPLDLRWPLGRVWMPATLAHARHWCRVLPSSACAAGIGQPCSSASFAFAAFEQPSHASRRTEPVVTTRCLPAQSIIKGGSMALPSTQQPTQTAVVLSMCLHVSCAAAWLCAARERRRSRHANSCGGQSSMPALERRHRTLLKLLRQTQESARARPCGQRSLSPWDPVIFSRLTVYRSLRPRASSRVD